MASIIDMMTRKKWRGPKPSQGAARGEDLTANRAAYVTRRGKTGFEHIGTIADRITRQLKAR